MSDLINKPVVNQSRERIGSLSDLVVTEIDKIHPRIHGLIIERGRSKQRVFIPQHDILEVIQNSVHLTTDLVDLSPYSQRTDEVLLVKDVYDKQIVDIDDRRLTRVNDLLLDENRGRLFLKGVDVSSVGVIRRLNLPALLLKRNVVDWEDVQFLGGNAPVKFKVQYKNLEALHPVDIARIIFEGPGYKMGSRVLTELKHPIAADIVEELSPKLQKNLIEAMKVEDVADVVKHMSPDKATDLLAILGPSYTHKILPLLDLKHAAEIRSLLTYPENSTGAYMTTEYVAIPATITLEQALTRIRKHDELPDFTYYFFVLENEFSNKLVGVVSNHDLLNNDGRTRVNIAMTRNLITASPHDHVKESLKKMYRYDLSALPVTSSGENKLLGIVTFRDAISIYLPKRWKTRIHRIFSNGGN